MGRDFHFHAAGFDARDVQKVIDQFDEVVRVQVDLAQAFLDRVGDVADLSGHEDRRVTFDGGERRAQLV